MSLKARRKRITAIKPATTDQITMPGSVEDQVQLALAEQLSFPHPATMPESVDQEVSQPSSALPAITSIDTDQEISKPSSTDQEVSQPSSALPAIKSTGVTRKIPRIALEAFPTLAPETTSTPLSSKAKSATGQIQKILPSAQSQPNGTIETHAISTNPPQAEALAGSASGAQQTGELSMTALRLQQTDPLSASDIIRLQQTGALVVTNDIHQQLVELQNSGMLPVIRSQKLQNDTTTGRLPVVIPGSNRKSTGMLLAPRPQGKRSLQHASVAFVLVCLLVGTLLTVLPLGAKGQTGLTLFRSAASMIQSKNSNTALIAAQVATATAVTQDGFDQGNRTYAGVAAAPVVAAAPAVPVYKPAAPTAAPVYKPAASVPSGIVSGGSSGASDAGSLSRFTYGQCTYWANMRYHALTGHWPSWLGNAYQWSYGAAAAGWVVSNTPNPHGPSIIVLQPYSQGAGAYGHVAVVETGAGPGSVSASNWNWAGHWASTTWVTFTSPAAGTKFIWYPGA